MTRNQLEHVIRAAAGNADVREIVVIGSQSILGAFPNAPEDLLASMEADVFPKDRPELSIVIDGSIGERSMFHETFGYYAHGVDETTAVLPTGWRERLVRVENENTRGSIGWCLEPHDLAVSKLVAAREKDLDFIATLLRHGLVAAETLRERLINTPFKTDDGKPLALARLDRLVKRVVRHR
ncbi:MAG: hypothetical protein FJ396_05370 [Verrucomicrobia bacterium]|nr:hypothetical protein [Verrucomicrobiota bacterium]